MDFLLDKLDEFKDIEQHTASGYTRLLTELYSFVKIQDPKNINSFTKNLINYTAEAVIINQGQFEVKLKQKTYNNSLYSFLNPNNHLYLYYSRMKKYYSKLLEFLKSKKEQIISLLFSKHYLFDSLNKLHQAEQTEPSQRNIDVKSSSFPQNESFKVVASISINPKYVNTLNSYTDDMKEIKTLLKLQTEIKANSALVKLENKKTLKCNIDNKPVTAHTLFVEETKQDTELVKKPKHDKTVFLFKNKEIKLEDIKGKVKSIDLKKKIGTNIGLKFNKIKLEIDNKIIKDIEVVDLDGNLVVNVKQKVRGGKHN